jgi:hypothetical protein
VTGPVGNRMSGDNFGYLVQAGSVGDVIINQARSEPQDRRLLPALRTMTAPLWLGPAPRTSFTVAPGRLVTFGTDVLFRDGGGTRHPCLCGAVEPGDELWALGYPRGDETAATVVGLRCPAVLAEDHTAPQQLELVFGEPGIGSTGGPVLNWRTGSVCGLLLVTDDTGLWLVPIQPVASADRAWLALMDDDQLRASGRRYPGADLRKYLADVRQLGEGHPYRPMVRQGPSLTAFYVPQHLYHEADGAHRITVAALADRHEGAQVLGDPGVGKSSLVRHLAADSATRWLAGEVGGFVPIPLSARALAESGPLPRLLAHGVTREITTMIDIPALVTMFEREPMPGVPWLVLVDGLDEVMNEFDRRLVLDRVLGGRDRELYRFLVTSRPLGRGAFDRLAQQYPTYVVEPFDDGELARFARAWFTDAGHHDVDRMVTDFMAEVARSGLGRLARVPLVSMMLCIVFPERVDGLPRSQYSVYERFFAVLARKLETSGTREEFRRHVSAYGVAAAEAVAGLLTGLPALLEEIAAAQLEHDTRPILTQAIERSAASRPSTIPVDTWAELVAEALRASGLLVHRKSDFRFLHRTIGEYLAARRLAARAGSAERRALLAPQTQWPWPHLEITIFVVALWTARGIDLTPQFARLLKSRHRDTNMGFLVELGRRGFSLPAHIHTRVGDILADRIHSMGSTPSERAEATRWLRDLDPSRAIGELTLLVRQRPHWQGALYAVTELTTLDPVRSMELAPTVACHEAHSPDTRLTLAKRVLAVDRAAGVEVLRKLAKSPGMGTLAVTAASLLAGEDRSAGTELLGWLATSEWSPEVPLAASRALLRWGENGVAELDRVWRSMPVGFAARLALTDQVAEVSREAAEWRYQNLVDAKDAPTDIRFAAAQGLARLNFEAGVRALRDLADDRRVPSPVRVEAAAYLAQNLAQGTDDLAAVAEDVDTVSLADRVEAARLLAQGDARRAAGVLAGIAMANDEQSHLAELAAELDEEESVRAMIRFVSNPKAPTEKRMAAAVTLAELGRAAEILQDLEEIASAYATPMPDRLSAATLIAGVDKARGRKMCQDLAEDQRLAGLDRIAAADHVRPFDEPFALALYLRISVNSRDATSRIAAALKAGDIDRREGSAALADLALSGSMDRHLHEIALAALQLDPEAAAQWRYLPKDAREAMQRAVRDTR